MASPLDCHNTSLITYRVPICNSAVGEDDEVIIKKIYEVIMMKIYEVILFKIHSIQETFSEHENLA